MHNYSEVRLKHGNKVSQTIDSPIQITSFWDLEDAFAALFVILIFGVLFYSWGLMFVLLTLTLVAGPIVKKKNNRGIYLHWPYKVLNMTLPGIVNPKGRRKYSD